MLTSKQRAKLRAMGNPLDTIFQIGKGGIGAETVKQIANALEARELIKARVLETCDYTAREAADASSRPFPLRPAARAAASSSAELAASTTPFARS